MAMRGRCGPSLAAGSTCLAYQGPCHRMRTYQVPVASANLRNGFVRFSVAHVGSFSSRGLVPVIFALLALDNLGPVARDITTTIALTVLLSVAAHGLAAQPFLRDASFSRSSRSGGDLASDQPTAVGRLDRAANSLSRVRSGTRAMDVAAGRQQICCTASRVRVT